MLALGECGVLGQVIRRLRLERGLRQEELGNAVGVSKQSVSNWENENIAPSVELLLRLADYFGVSTDYLLERTDRSTVDATGLTERQMTHIQQLIEDLRGKA